MSLYETAVTKTGMLRTKEIQRLVGEDPVAAQDLIVEMYGMIWGLATDIANESYGPYADAKLYVDSYAANPESGLIESPGTYTPLSR